MTSKEKVPPCLQDGQAETTHRPWCHPDCDRREPSILSMDHEHVLSIARMNYGPTVSVGLGNERLDPNQDEVLLQVRREDSDQVEHLGLEPEEARMLARFLTDAADEWELHRGRGVLASSPAAGDGRRRVQTRLGAVTCPPWCRDDHADIDETSSSMWHNGAHLGSVQLHPAYRPDSEAVIQVRQTVFLDGEVLSTNAPTIEVQVDDEKENSLQLTSTAARSYAALLIEAAEVIGRG
jgi:hypothetical protein